MVEQNKNQIFPWNKPGATPLSIGLDLAGSGLASLSGLGILSGVGLIPGGLGLLGSVGLHNAADTARGNNQSVSIAKENPKIQQVVTNTPQQPARRNYGFRPDTIQGKIVSEAYRQGVDPALALAVARQESGFNPNAFGDVNVGGSYGLFQIHRPSHPDYKGGFNVDENIKYGVGFLKNLSNSFNNDIQKVIMAYNAGAGAVNSGNIPASTRQKYLPGVMGFYNEYNKGGNTYTPQINQRPLGGSATPVNYEIGYVNPPRNTTALNKLLNASKNNKGNNIMMNNPSNQDMANLLNNIQMISSFARGAQQGNQLPNLGVSNEELQAYSQALEQFGRNIAGARKDLDTYKQAMGNVARANAMAPVLNAVGSAAINALDTRYRPMFDVTGRSYIGDRTGALRDPKVLAFGNNAASGMRNNLDLVNNLIQMNDAQRQLELQRQQQAADLLTAARVSNETGLPLQVTRQMTPSDYMNYIKPTQEGQNKIQEQAMQGVVDAITDKQQQVADYTKAIDEQALQNLGQYNTEALSQQGQNLRQAAQLENQYNIAMMDNATRRYIIQQTGLNAQQLENLRQSDPNAFYRAIGPVLMAATYSAGTPAAQTAGLYINNLLLPLMGQQGTTQQTPDQSYWSQFNK